MRFAQNFANQRRVNLLAGQQILKRVVDKLGGIEAAARHLGVNPSLLERMLDGTRSVPDMVLLKAIDLALEEQVPALPSVAPEIKPQGRTAT